MSVRSLGHLLGEEREWSWGDPATGGAVEGPVIDAPDR